MRAEIVAFLLIGSLSEQQHPDGKQAPCHTMQIKGEQVTRPGAILRKEAVCLCLWQQEVAAVPEIRRRGPFQSQTGHIHGGVHQQEENGHNAGNGVELPGEKDQLAKDRESGVGGRGVNTSEMGEMTVL